MADRPRSADRPRPSRAAAEAPRWGLGDAALGVAVGFLAASVTVAVWMALAGSEKQSLGTMAAGWLGLWLGFVGVPVLASRGKGHRSLSADFGLEARGVDAAGLAVGAGCQLLVLPAMYFLIQRLTGDLTCRARPGS